MNEQHPKLTRVNRLSPIWLVPIIALLIAAWLAFASWRDSGPQIEVVFDDAAGITVGRTQVRFRDVVVGKVTNIKLSDSFETVTVYIELDPQVEPLVSDNTRFWVVSPRISASGISGLDTLVSGVYIEMDPGEEGEPESRFAGLIEPPSVRSYEEGTQYTLLSEDLGSLDIGSPVYHRQIPVGEVTRYRLVPEAGKVELRIFIDAPYDKLIKTNTNFWNVSGFGFEIGSKGVVAHVETFSALVSGGLAFSTPPDIDGEHTLARPSSQFHLFEDKQAVAEGALTFSYPYLLQFRSSVRGLNPGASVEFRGIQIGKVDHVGLDAGIDSEREIDVLISIQPERIDPDEAPTLAELNQLFAQLVAEGMRAELKTDSFITGTLLIDLVPNASPVRMAATELEQQGDFLILPTADGQYAEIAKRLASIVDSVQKMPLESIGGHLDDTLQGVSEIVREFKQSGILTDIDALIGGLDGSTGSLQNAIASLQSTLESLEQTIAPDSELHYELLEMLDEVGDAAKSMERLTDELSRYPDALLRGRNEK